MGLPELWRYPVKRERGAACGCRAHADTGARLGCKSALARVLSL